MHENATATVNSKWERDSLLLQDIGIEIVAMENGNHTADLPRRTQLQVSCRSIQGVPSARGQGLVEFWVLHFLLISSWAEGNLAESGAQLDRMVKQPIQGQPNPGP